MVSSSAREGAATAPVDSGVRPGPGSGAPARERPRRPGPAAGPRAAVPSGVACAQPPRGDCRHRGAENSSRRNRRPTARGVAVGFGGDVLRNRRNTLRTVGARSTKASHRPSKKQRKVHSRQNASWEIWWTTSPGSKSSQESATSRSRCHSAWCRRSSGPPASRVSRQRTSWRSGSPTDRGLDRQLGSRCSETTSSPKALQSASRAHRSDCSHSSPNMIVCGGDGSDLDVHPAERALSTLGQATAHPDLVPRSTHRRLRLLPPRVEHASLDRRSPPGIAPSG